MIFRDVALLYLLKGFEDRLTVLVPVTLCLQPVYITTLLAHDISEEENQEMGGVEDGNAVEEKEGGETEDAESEGGNENDNRNGGGGESGRKDKGPPLRFQTYKEAVKRYCLLHTDFNMVGSFRSIVVL